MPQTIFCDESGFTGTNLSDEEQPNYVYASVAIDPEQAAALVAKTTIDFRLQSSEIKGRRLLRSGQGRRAISYVLQECASRSQVVISDKRYALACKVFEYVFEPALASKNWIFYNLGFHKFVSTMLYVEMQINRDPAEKLARDFYAMMRTNPAVGVANLLQGKRTTRRTRSVAGEIRAFAKAQAVPITDELNTISELGEVGRWTLDVTDAALYSLLCHWGQIFEEMEVLCDESKALFAYLRHDANLFAQMVGRKDKQYVEIAGEKKCVTFNLARPIALVDSKGNPGIQLADVIAAATSFAVKHPRSEEAAAWLEILEHSSTVNGDSIVPNKEDVDFDDPKVVHNLLIFRELVRRCRANEDLLEGIEDFVRFPYRPRKRR